MEPRLCKNFVASEKPEESIETLHFISRFDEKKGLYAFVCEEQPLLTLTSYGLPERCPFCRQGNPIGSEIQ